MKLILTGKSLLLISLGIWMGSLIFFATSVAPEIFRFAEAWSLRAIHPSTRTLIEFPRTIAGYMTSGIIGRMNTLGTFCFLTGSFGLFLCWFPKDNRSMYLMTKTLLFFLIGLVHYVLVFVISDEMFRILQSGLVDLVSTQPSPDVQQFRYLHGWYSRLAVLQMILATALVFVVTFKPFRTTGTTLK